MIVRNPLGRWRRPFIALAAFGATALLGLAGPALPGPAPLFGWGGWGLLLAGSAGLLAWHIARLRVTPGGAAGDAGAALPAALLALVIPTLGAAALLTPVALAILCAWRDSAHRRATLAILSGALALLVGTAASPFLGAFACATIPALAWVSWRGAVLEVANDNPSLERVEQIWSLQSAATYANQRRGNPESGSWGVA